MSMLTTIPELHLQFLQQLYNVTCEQKALTALTFKIKKALSLTSIKSLIMTPSYSCKSFPETENSVHLMKLSEIRFSVVLVVVVIVGAGAAAVVVVVGGGGGGVGVVVV